MHHAEGHRIGDLDVETVVFDVGNDGFKGLFDVFAELPPVELQQLGLHGLALGIDTVALGRTEMVAEAFELPWVYLMSGCSGADSALVLCR